MSDPRNASRDPDDEAIGSLALHALGAGSPAERERVEERLRSKWSRNRGELESLREVAARLALAAWDATPATDLRARIFAGIDAEPSRFAFASDGQWHDFEPGVHVRILFRDESSGRATALVRLDAGARLTPHRHLGPEELYCIEGDCRVSEDIVLHPGDFFRAETGSLHHITRSEGGALVLAITHGLEVLSA